MNKRGLDTQYIITLIVIAALILLLVLGMRERLLGIFQ